MEATTLDKVQAILARAKRLGATAADAVIVESTDISCSCRKGVPESIERAESINLGLRVFVGQQQAIVSSSDLREDTLAMLAERAVDMARASPADPDAVLATPDMFAKNLPDLDLCDFAEPSTEWLHEHCKRTEDAALAVKGVSNSQGADASYSRSNVAIATSHGFQFTYPSSSFSLSVAVLAGEGTAMERDYDYSSTRHRADLRTPEEIGETAARKTLARLNPRKMESCQVPVLFEPKIAKALISTFAGAISGSAVVRGTTFLKDAMGKAIFNPAITIVDDPHIKRGLGSRPCDAEGVANGKRNLVENGVLQSWFLDLRSAKKLGLTPTGDASRSTSAPPYPSSSNLYLAVGNCTPKELIEDIKSGLYVTDTFGSGSNLVTGDMSVGVSGFWIENGEIAYPVSEITLAGDLREMYQRLIPANDLEFRFATNAPTVRIDGMIVGGR